VPDSDFKYVPAVFSLYNASCPYALPLEVEATLLPNTNSFFPFLVEEDHVSEKCA